MKKIFKYSLVITFMLGLSTSCDLDIKPVDSVIEDDALNDAKGLQALLIGAYDRLSDDDLYGGWIQMTSDLLGSNNDINWGGTFFDPRDMWRKEVTAFNAQLAATWTEAYETINVTNKVLSRLDLVGGPGGPEEGGAKFIRGVMYFELVRLFAKDWNDGDPNVNLGVPIKLEPTNLVYNPEVDFLPRNTVAAVYQRVISDLTDAINLLPDENSFFATSWSAKAMLARVHMQRHEFDEARILANDIIENGPFSINDRVDRAFNLATNTDEDIFAVQVTPQDGINDFHTFYASRVLNGRRDIRIRSELASLYEDTDERGECPDENCRTSLIYEDFDGSGRLLSGKYTDQFANISIIRLAEMYLIRAEANFMMGDQVGPNTPGQDLEVIRERARASDAPANPTLADIMLERKLELAFEGHFLHDIRRTQGTIAQFGPISWDDDILVMPIPQREIDANPALDGQQNPGY